MLDERPTAAELIAAVAGFLEKKAAPQLDAATAFHLKVAINALRIVERELQQGDRAAAGDRERLAALLGTVPGNAPGNAPGNEAGNEAGSLRALNAELCARIEAGTIGTGDRALHEHLLRSTLDRIAIDSPKYPSLKAAPLLS